MLVIIWPWGREIILDYTEPNVVESLDSRVCWNIMSLCQKGGRIWSMPGCVLLSWPHLPRFVWESQEEEEVIAHTATQLAVRERHSFALARWLVCVKKKRQGSSSDFRVVRSRSGRNHWELCSAQKPMASSRKH